MAERRNAATRSLCHRLRQVQSSACGDILLCNDRKVLNIMTRFYAESVTQVHRSKAISVNYYDLVSVILS